MNETPELFVLASIHACRLWRVFRRKPSNASAGLSAPRKTPLKNSNRTAATALRM
jgi:hypothetical protein